MSALTSARIASASALRLALILMMLGFGHGSARADETSGPENGTIASDAEGETDEYGEKKTQEGVAYTVKIDGLDDESTLKDLFEKSSQLLALKSRLPLTEAALDRRTRNDIDRFNEVLRSEGFYAGTVSYQIDTEKKPAEVVITVDRGPPFLLKSYTVSFVGDQPAPDKVPDDQSLGIKLNHRGRAVTVVAAENRVLELLANDARPLARIDKRTVIVDYADNSMTVTLDVDPGPVTRFGETKISGLTNVDESYIRELIPWKQGQPYDARKVNKLRITLLETALFSTVEIDHGDTVDNEDEVPITIAFVEGKQRSIGAAAKYSTSEGPAGEIFWQHRNLFGRNEDLTISVEGSKLIQTVTFDVLAPDVGRPEQDLFATLTGTHQDTRAFKELGLETIAGVRRPIARYWKISLGGSLEVAELEDQDGKRNLYLGGVPLSFIYDSTDSKLNPKKGLRGTYGITPYAGEFQGPLTFVKNSFDGSAYQSLDTKKRYVLAARVGLGSIYGESRSEIPPNKRFYAGGDGTVRGYEFQRLGPLDDSKDPLGGRSLFDMSLEARLNVWGPFGVVPFIDGGTVFKETYPSFDETIRWAAGLGLRYDTAIGPVRFDVAFPLNPRNGIDDPFQFYIGLGQSF